MGWLVPETGKSRGGEWLSFVGTGAVLLQAGPQAAHCGDGPLDAVDEQPVEVDQLRRDAGPAVARLAGPPQRVQVTASPASVGKKTKL